jgi:hypothetical protein
MQWTFCELITDWVRRVPKYTHKPPQYDTYLVYRIPFRPSLLHCDLVAISQTKLTGQQIWVALRYSAYQNLQDRPGYFGVRPEAASRMSYMDHNAGYDIYT